jgi:DNA topoisomerase-1
LNGIDRKAYDVYTCIWNRTVASQMNDAKGVTTTINIAGGDADAMFASVGTVFSDLGWMRLTKPVNDSDDTNALPMVHEHDEAELVSLKPSMHDTEPPARFTEPQLVAKLEELGIGRPSTYASIVSVNQERGYVKKKGKAMYPTFRGMQVAQILESKLSSFVDYGYTANMETELDKIEHGSKKRNDFLDEIWSGKKGIEHNVLSLSKNIDWEEINAYSTIDLGNGYIVQVSRNGAWLQNPESPKNEQGFRTGAKLDDDAMVTDFMSVETCVSTLSQAADRNDNRELGILSSGPYKGWTVTVRDGKYGAYAQAVKPKATKKDKPVNMTLTEGMDMRAVTLDDIAGLFAETKLPRQLGEGFFTGIGKRGPWIGYKSKPRGKAKFKSLPDGNDPRTIELDTAKSIWNS